MASNPFTNDEDHADVVTLSLDSARALTYHLKTVWLFTVSDHVTFVLPESLFGLFGALSGPALTTNPSPTISSVFSRLPSILIWTWLNTFVFVLSNQSNPDAIKEDSLNKPWRPLPARRITFAQTRKLLLFTVPAVLAGTYFCFGAFEETAVLFSLTWMYNEMGGADGNFIMRNFFIAVAYAFYGSGALRIAAGFPQHGPSHSASRWLATTAGVIFSTMSIQDLKDEEGDRARGRRTAPIVLGENPTRYFIALAVLAWSWLCPIFWGVRRVVSAPCVALGLFITIRLIVLRNRDADRISWKLWSCWVMGIYCLPLCARGGMSAGQDSHA